MELWKINEELQRLESEINAIIESNTALGIEDNSEADKLFEEWLVQDSNFKEKVLNTAEYIKYLEALTEARKEEANRIKELAKESERRASKLRDYVGFFVSKRLGVSNLEGEKVKVSLRKKPDELIIDSNIDNIPEDYLRIKKEVDKVKVREALKKDPSLDFAKLVPSETPSVVIR